MSPRDFLRWQSAAVTTGCLQDRVRSNGDEHRRHLATRAAEVRLNDLQHKTGGYHSVERITTILQHRHTRRRRQPMRRGHHAVGPNQLRARGKHPPNIAITPLTDHTSPPTCYPLIELGGKTATGIAVPDEIVAALGGGKRPAVRVTLGGHCYRTTVARMGGGSSFAQNGQPGGRGVVAGDEVEAVIEMDRPVLLACIARSVLVAIVRLVASGKDVSLLRVASSQPGSLMSPPPSTRRSTDAPGAGVFSPC